MGYAFQGICHPTQADANIAFCQSLSQSGLNNSGQVVLHNCTAINASNVTLSKQINTTTTTQTVAYPPYLTCTYEGTTLIPDYFGVGLAALALVFAAKLSHRFFTDDMNPA